MEQAPANEETVPNNASRPHITTEAGPSGTVVPQQGSTTSCPTCAAAQAAQTIQPLPFVYVIGHIEPRYPRLSTEKELAQVTGRAETVGLTDKQALQRILGDRQNRYLVRQLCWVLTVQGLETYILIPRDPADYDLLIQAVRSSPNPADLDVVVGVRGPVANPEVCNGLLVPILIFDQIYSFDRDSLIKAIPQPPNVEAEKFTAAAGEVLDRIIQQADNAGAMDAHRALNYLAVRYPVIYANAANAYAANASLTAVNVQPSQLSSTRNIVEVIFAYTNRNTDVVEKYFARVDVTEEFPFLVTKLSPYYDR
jgi:PatG C-terminal